MDAYPVFLRLAGRPCLLVGGGAAAVSKAELLLRAGAELVVAAERLAPQIAEWAAAGRLRWRRERFAPEDVRGVTLVIAATDDEALARRVSAAAEAAGVPVNVVDRPELSSFIAGAVVDRSPVLVAISTGGSSPVLAREIRLAIERLLPAALGRLARFARHFRSAVKAALPSPSLRRRFWQDFFKGPVARAVLAGDERGARRAMLALVNRPDAARSAGGVVHIVGAGPGDPELLTLRAQRLLGEADVVVYDRLVAPAVLEHARRDAERRFVGKAKGAPAASQDAINELLARLASQGKRVVRLKGGDPFVFGRGGEELEYLRQHGIAVEVVPGISAALGCAAASQIPLTHRALASAVTLVTGHGSAGGKAVDWAALAKLPGTLAIYMGVGASATIAAELVAHGLAPSTPAAIVENGTRPDERTIVGTLGELPRLAARHAVAGPALIIVGEVVRLAKSGTGFVPARAVNA